MKRLISFDIDGTLEVGDPPGEITLATVRLAHELGIVIGSCSDRPVGVQQALWAKHDIPMRFTVLKQNLMDVRASFDVDHYMHTGDSPIDEQMAREAEFEFLDSLQDAEARFQELLTSGWAGSEAASD
ncbi:MAG TPA: HAD family hydrolase [Dehalococcoidia bacterium]|nr:HAD family hydrolase [Dehalococcoidia bacterium]